MDPTLHAANSPASTLCDEAYYHCEQFWPPWPPEELSEVNFLNQDGFEFETAWQANHHSHTGFLPVPTHYEWSPSTEQITSAHSKSTNYTRIQYHSQAPYPPAQADPQHLPMLCLPTAQIHQSTQLTDSQHLSMPFPPITTENHTDRSPRQHLTPDPLKCGQCGRVFTRKWNTKQHMQNVHEGIRPHKCPACSKAYSRRYDLKKHTCKCSSGYFHSSLNMK
ncbi:hypothetical protein BV20DRAFT_278136 [Pilatotrama ljubarskyi]|nr:hypothetical protein BV20DRAFT_278136 [Pilatotrama ljubarskyi]